MPIGNIPLMDANELAAFARDAIQDGRTVEITTVRVTGRDGGGRGPGLAKRRQVIDSEIIDRSPVHACGVVLQFPRAS